MTSIGAAAAAEEISDADFDRFRSMFYRKTGIYFEDSKRYFVDKRLKDRMKQTGHTLLKATSRLCVSRHQATSCKAWSTR